MVGIDLGGTRTRAVLSDGERFLRKMEEKTSRTSAKSISEKLVDMIRTLCEGVGGVEEIDGICIGSAGPIDYRKGELVNPANLPFGRVPLVGPIEAELGVSTYLLNDCTAGVIGEHEFGAGKGIDDLVYITMGTGIGGGAYVDGHLLGERTETRRKSDTSPSIIGGASGADAESGVTGRPIAPG